jgi:DNA-binding CsgD family transcriptional regulator
MISPLVEKKRRAPPTASVPRDDVPGLVRRLVKELNGQGPAEGHKSSDGEDVLLDVQVDGVRCVLLRVPPQPPGLASVLSPREREIARMVARGYANKTIAGVLEISSWTVGTYLRRIFAKLHVGSRAAMVARVIEGHLLKD